MGWGLIFRMRKFFRFCVTYPRVFCGYIEIIFHHSTYFLPRFSVSVHEIVFYTTCFLHIETYFSLLANIKDLHAFCELLLIFGVCFFACASFSVIAPLLKVFCVHLNVFVRLHTFFTCYLRILAYFPVCVTTPRIFCSRKVSSHYSTQF